MIDLVIAGLARQLAIRLVVFFAVAFIAGAVTYAGVTWLRPHKA